MATKTISITEEAYNVLKERKEGNESFSEVIVQSFPKHSILELAGALTGKEADELKRHIASGRKLSRARLENTAHKLK